MNRREVLLGMSAVAAAPPPALHPLEIEPPYGFFVDSAKPSRTAVIMCGGSDGGSPSRKAAIDLAAEGYPVLGLSYFNGWSGKIAGLPAALADIRLEYVFEAVTWLRRRTGAKRIIMLGESRGAELVLAAAAYGADVQGIVAFSPSSIIWPAPMMAPQAPQQAAWTLGGKALPFRPLPPAATPYAMFEAALTDLPADSPTIIPIEKFKGDVLLFSSKVDAIWPAAKMAQQLVERRQGRDVESVVYDRASHLLMGVGPGVVRFEQGPIKVEFGGDVEGATEARAAAWAKTKRFLAT